MSTLVSTSVVLLVAAVAQLLLRGAGGQVLATLYNDSACTVPGDNANQPLILQMARSVPPSAVQPYTGNCVNLTAPYIGSGFWSCEDDSFLQLYYWQAPDCEGARSAPSSAINGTSFISGGQRANSSVCSSWSLITYAGPSRYQRMSGYLTYSCYNTTHPAPNAARATAAASWSVQLSVGVLLLLAAQRLVPGVQAV